MSQGRIVSIAFNPERGMPRPLHDAAELQPDHGIVGDHRAGGDPERALNMIDLRHVEALQALGYDVRPGVLGENLLVRGLDLDRLPVGTRLQLGDAVIARISRPRTPCGNLTYIHPDFPAVAEGRVGQLCAVERGGHLRVDDPVRVLPAADGPPY